MTKNAFHTIENDKVQSKTCQNDVPFLNLHIPKCKENIYLEYMNITCQPAATRLMIDIKHQPDRIELWLTFDIKHQPDRVWLTFDIKHQPGRVLVDV